MKGLKHGRANVYNKYDDYFSKGPGNFYIRGSLEGTNQIMLNGDTMMQASYNYNRLNGRAAFFLHYKVYDGTGASYSRWRLIEESMFKNGLKHGSCVRADEYNEVSEAGFYKDGLKDSVWRRFITYGGYKGEVLDRVTYVRGLRQGPAEAFFSAYKDTLDGDTVIVYRKVSEYVEFKDDVLHGDYVLSAPTGIVMESGSFVEGKRHGRWQEVAPSGDEFVIWKGKYVEDKKEGEWIGLDKKKTMRIKGNYINGLADGLWLFYDEKKVKVAEKLFYEGHLFSLRNFQGLEDLSSVVISKLSKDAMRLNVELVADYRTSILSYQYIGGDTMPVLDTMVNYFDMGNGNYNDSFLKLDGKHYLYSHDTLILLEQYSMGKLIGSREHFNYEQGVKVVNLYENDSMVSERFYTLDGKPFSGVYEMLVESPPNREVIRVRKGRRKGYTEYYGRLTGRYMGRVKF